MTLVFDATPLIYLGKADRLDVLARLDSKLLVPERVYEEVVERGIERGYADARRVNDWVKGGPLERERVEATDRFARLTSETRLSPADTAVLLLADEVDGTAVMDERYGRDIADTEEIDTRGTAFLILSLMKRRELTSDDARETIDAMLDAGWHCSPNLYAKILRTLDSLASE
ncbi:DUF3368 domain-containing protein [Halorussus amylolyticus]|uniref:DUF3368 domain-containing protein n=1 Tax=Halorussus amylolyticus TaxID=1126242 RepID=UPI0010499A89|nr:DUF3368 domain-containing protein [Halorussus amylolyticus]